MTTKPNPLKVAMMNMQASKTQITNKSPEPISTKTNIKPPSRQGKKVISGHFEPLAAQQLKFLGVEQERSVQSLLEEAINDLFRKYDKSSIA